MKIKMALKYRNCVSPILASVFKSSTGSTNEKLAQSRLLAVFLELKLEMEDSSNVAVAFGGIRKRQYTNVDPTRFEFAGSVGIA